MSCFGEVAILILQYSLHPRCQICISEFFISLKYIHFQDVCVIHGSTEMCNVKHRVYEYSYVYSYHISESVQSKLVGVVAGTVVLLDVVVCQGPHCPPH